MGTAGDDIAASVVLGQPEARLIGFWLPQPTSSQRLAPCVGFVSYGGDGSMRHNKFKVGQSVLPAHPRRAWSAS